MRIAFVYDIPYPWHKGGIEYILNNEAKELAKNNEVHYFTMRWPGMKNEFTYENVRYHAFGNVNEHTAYRHGRRSIREAYLFSLHLASIFRYDFEMIITNAFPLTHLPILRLYSKIKGCKFVLMVDEIWDRDYWVRYLGGILGNMADFYSDSVVRSGGMYYIANSSLTAERLSKKGIKRDRISIFAPVLDNGLLERALHSHSEVSEKRIIFSGRLIKEKRLDKWLSIVREVTSKDNEVKAVIIGHGVEAIKIRSLIEKLDIKGNVEIRPFYKDKINLYREIMNSSVFLHMSEREGLSIITLESIALGTPVVLPDYSPIPNEVKGMCVVRKEEEIGETLLEIIKSREKGRYIKNTRNLRMFENSRISEFYEQIMKAKGSN